MLYENKKVFQNIEIISKNKNIKINSFFNKFIKKIIQPFSLNLKLSFCFIKVTKSLA